MLLVAPPSPGPCPICWETLAQKDAKKLGCRHLFHRNCLAEWVRREQSCPVCFTKLGDKSTPASPAGPGALARAASGVLAAPAGEGGGEGEGEGGGGAAAVPPESRHVEPVGPMPPPVADDDAAAAAADDDDADVVLPWWLQWADRLVRGRRRLLQTQLTPDELNRVTAQLAQIFPHVDPALISADLQLTGNAEITSENIIEGRLGNRAF